MNEELTFNHYQKVNRARCEAGFFSLDKWSIAEWTNALAGECGEACNIANKIVRDDDNQTESISALIDLAEEIADVIGYADLCMSRIRHELQKLGVEDEGRLKTASTGDAVVEKFNKVNRRLVEKGHLQMLQSEDGKHLPHELHNAER